MKWNQRLVLITFFLSFYLSVMLLFSLWLHFSIFLPPLSHHSYLFLIQSAALLLGSQLGTMEGTSDIPRLHRDEDTTPGSRVQQKETVTDGQREQQILNCSQETGEQPKLEEIGSVPLTLFAFLNIYRNKCCHAGFFFSKCKATKWFY